MQSVLLILFSFVLFPFMQDHERKAFYIEGDAQGTTYHITYFSEDSVVTKGDIDGVLSSIDSSLSIYKPYSLISQFNLSSEGIKIDQHFQDVIKRSLEVYNETGGAFDITVEPLVQAWGFGVKKETTQPDAEKIRSILQCTGSDKLQLNGNMLRKTSSCIKIDVNGIAQGYSVDVLAQLLEKKGISNYLVELGGEIRVEGRKLNGKKLSIGIEAPAKNEFDPSTMQRMIWLEHGAVTTSGNYRKFYESGGKKISHLIDPHSGYPVQNELISVTVYAKDAITADGFDNALMVYGLKKSFEFLKRHPEMEAYFIYHKPDGTVADTATQGFYKLVNSSL